MLQFNFCGLGCHQIVVDSCWNIDGIENFHSLFGIGDSGKGELPLLV